jgi:ribosomal protein uS7
LIIHFLLVFFLWLFVVKISICPMQNPVQVLVSAVVNSGPREDSTRVGRAGTVRRQAVDVSPLRRVNQAIFLLTTGARAASFRNVKTISECLADELINAAKVCSSYSLAFLVTGVAASEAILKFCHRIIALFCIPS